MPDKRKPQKLKPSRSAGRSPAAGRRRSGYAKAARHGARTHAGKRRMPKFDTAKLDEKVVDLPIGEKPVTLTRRHFLLGAAGVAAVAAVGAGSAVLAAGNDDEDEAGESLTVPESSVFTFDDCDQADIDDCFDLVGSYSLPYGTLAWTNNDKIAACLLPTDTASPLVELAALWLSSGNYYTILSEAVGSDEGFEIFDARISENGVVWVEAHVMQGTWRVLCATLSDDLTMGEAQVLQEGDSSQEVPSIGAVGSHAYWQVMPASSSDDVSSLTSRLKRADFSSPSPKVLYEAPGRMSCPLYAGSSGVAIAARNAEYYSYYDLVYFDDESGKATDTLTLPYSMAPNVIGYGPNGFSFGFEDIYDYGDGISNLGTYTPASARTGSSNYSDEEWFRFSRTPYTSPCWCTDRWLMVKSTSSVCGVDPAQRVYCSLDVESGCEDWGDYLISSGAGSVVATLMQIDQITTSGEEEHYALLRVWESATESE